MRTSSTNSIMIGIAICDLIVLSENVYERVQGYWFFNYDNPCVNDFKYWYLYSLHVGEILQTIFEKASFGLGVSLALTRLVIMKAAGTTLKISKPLFGYLLILVLVGLSSVHSLYYFRIFSFNPMGNWEPIETCTGYPANYSEPAFYRGYQDNKIRSQIVTRYKMINGVFRILVSVAYPILAILLIFEIRKSAKFASKALNSKISEERYRTCRMIIVMTVFYVIASTPTGFSEYVQLFVTLGYNSIWGTLLIYGTYLISAVVCLNASSHAFINFAMSSKYRQTVKTCLGMEKQQQQQGSMVLVSILVSVSYPILTVFLFFELRKSAKFASKALSKRSAEERHRTSRMILVKSIFYVIASTPAGISEYVVLFVTIEPQSILETLVGYGSIFISALFCLNASSHGIISLTMSTKYRETVKKCLGWEKQRQGSIISVSRWKSER
ncbi:hypothetical protein B9Z55_017327 [Caenorhabditis nigoni]|uniref:G-protein coupled receptors family 1 profile domain-containing protein n=1 Tax=Caenorhabditis nigoni TaxID=1611254 RepID=A0A2G5T915_9PELO|nr:hypothetical protein B9Z55_017327 [Caenorhabditis nigoni]